VLTYPPGLASGVFLADSRADQAATPVSPACAEGRLAPRGRCLAMASVRAPISSVAAIRPPYRCQALALGEEDLHRRWRDGTLVSRRNFTPGRQKSLGAHKAPSCAARQVSLEASRPRGTIPEGLAGGLWTS